MSDTTSTDNIIRKRERALAWFTAASATYLDLGLTTEQRICLYEECFGIAQEHIDSRLLLLCTNVLNTLIKTMVDDEMIETMEYLANAHLEEKEYDDKVAEMNAYMTLGEANFKKEEYDASILYSKKCLAIAQESGHKMAEMKSYTMLGNAHFYKDEYDDAILNSEKCLAIAQESGHKMAEMTAYTTLGNAHFDKEEYEDAILYSKKRLVIAQESGDKVAEMNAYMMLGNAHLNKEEYDDAILNSEKCLAIRQESGDKVDEMNAYITLGEAHLKKEEYDDALVYSRKCIAIAQESGDKVAEMNAYILLVDAHLKKEEYDDAIVYSKKCLAIAQESGVKVAEMTAYIKLGNAHLKKEEYDDAILNSKKCLVIAQESGDKVAEMTAYMKLGNAHLKKEEYDDAILYSEKCLAIAQESGDKVAEMTAYMTLGDAQMHKEEYDDAILYSKKRLVIAQESGDKVAEMNTYMMLGNAHVNNKEYDDVILNCEKCLPISQESGDKVAEMNAYILLGIAHSKKEEYDDVISYSKKCLAVAQESGDKGADHEITAYMALGEAHMHKEECDDAILYSKKCLAIAQESGDKVAEITAYMTLGDAQMHKEEYDDAILYSKKCLALAQESGDKVAEMKGYMTLGNAHFGKKEDGDALLYNKKCLDVAQESGDKVAEMKGYMTLGAFHLNKEEYDDAYSLSTEGMTIARSLEDNESIRVFRIYLNMIHKAVGITEDLNEDLSIAAFNHSVVHVPKNQSLLHWFDCYSRYIDHRAQHEYEHAISCLEEAEVAAATTHGNYGILRFRSLSWMCMDGISEMCVLLGQYDKGVQYQQEALDAARKDGMKSNQAMSHFSLGEVYYKLEQFENAEKSFKESLKCYELIFDGLKQNDRFKIAFVEKYKNAYKMLLKVLIETNKKEEALVVSDHYRAKALKDLLVSSYGMKKEQVGKEGLQYVDVQSLFSNSSYTLLFYSTCFEELYTFLVEAGNELECSVQHFKYCDTCLDKLVDKTFDDMKVRQVVNFAEDRSLDVMDDSEENKNPKKYELTQLLTREKEKRLSEQCRSTCGSRGKPSENSDESSLTSGLEILYHKLIHNIKCLIKQDEIVIIPDGPLCKVPFAALRDPDTGQYLSETKRIRMAPSMASLKLLQDYPEEHHSTKDALIIGASLVRGVMMDGKEGDFDYLDGALDEAIDIGLILGVRPLLAALATKPAVLEKLQKGASVVHIAAHGNQEKATIVLAPSPEIRNTKIPSEEDYMLTMAEVQAIQVRAQLVVLSCCHSGRGEIKAEGVVGMCRAFLASGARAVVGSLWEVHDDATWKFMETFYTYLKDGKSASTSLHLTMNDMRRTPQYSEPKYWAPFFLMGDDVTIQFKD